MIMKYEQILKEKYKQKLIVEKELSKNRNVDQEILDNRIMLVKIRYILSELEAEIALLEKNINKLNFIKQVREFEDNSRISKK